MKKRRGFTLVELLVVIGIIGVLVAILIPVIGKVRISAQTADSKNFINQLVGALERYHGDFQAYPGPIKNSDIRPAATPAVPVYDLTGTNVLNGQLTGSENLVLGLCGGLRILTGTPNKVVYDPDQLGRGPVNITLTNPKRYEPYMEKTNLSAGKYSDALVSAIDDTAIPEFMDRYSASLPILYLRARPGAARDANVAISADNNNVISTDSTGHGQYQLSDIIAYTQDYSTSKYGIGTEKNPKRDYYLAGTNKGKVIPATHGLKVVTIAPKSMTQGDATYTYPYDGYAYFLNQSIVSTEPQARSKDSYILISAGPDRIYGTEDDITSFGDITGN